VSGRKRSYECAYCGATSARTDDHVPPKAIYAKPLPSKVPTVKACDSCNAGASQDDEYFRDVVLKYHRVADLPQAQQQLAAMFRAAKKPQKAKYAAATLRSFVETAFRTPAGLILGPAPAYRVDVPRLERAVSRYVRGLHRYQLGARVPDGSTVTTAVYPDHIVASTPEVLGLFSRGSRRVIQPGVFWYSWVLTTRQGFTGWLLVFFDVFPVLGYVHPPVA
jgi:hypothetical protein